MSNKPIPPRRPQPTRFDRLALFFATHRTSIIAGLYFAAGFIDHISRPKGPTTPRRRSTKAPRLP